MNLPTEITMPIEGLIMMALFAIACMALGLISYACLRQVIGLLPSEQDLYVDDRKGECDVPPEALRGKARK
jgi:hypothetical protein